MVHLSPEGNSANSSSTSSSIEENEDEISFERSSSSLPVFFQDLKANVTVEPIVFLHCAATACSSVITQNMYIDRICRLQVGYNDTLCSNLTDEDNFYFETVVDKSAANFTMYRGAIETGFPILFSLFLGPWTDKHRTKPTVLLPILGYIMSSSLYLTFSLLPNFHPDYLLLCSVPIALSGGMVALVLSVFSFMAKYTSSENRSFRIAVLELSWVFGLPVGYSIGGAIFKRFGYPAVFITSMILFTISFLYGLFFVHEGNSDVHQDNMKTKSVILDVFNIGAIKDVFATIFRSRNGSARSLILLLILTICMKVFTVYGAANVSFLFVREQLHWDYQKFTTYSTVDTLIQISGGLTMTFFTMKLFKLRDTTIGIFSSLGYSMGAIIFAFTTAGWMMYVGSVIQMFCGLTTIIIRSMISKCVGREELAKVYTFVACGEAIMPPVATALYSTVFQLTIDVFPGAMYFITAGVNIVVFFLFVYFHYVMRKQSPHVLLDENSS